MCVVSCCPRWITRVATYRLTKTLHCYIRRSVKWGTGCPSIDTLQSHVHVNFRLKQVLKEAVILNGTLLAFRCLPRSVVWVLGVILPMWPYHHMPSSAQAIGLRIIFPICSHLTSRWGLILLLLLVVYW